MIRIESNYLVHEGGSKFYETVLIWDEAKPDRPCLIKRWGPIAKKDGGGQTKTEYASSLAAAQLAVAAICNEKTRDRPGKGSYEYRALAGSICGAHTISDSRLVDVLSEHYDDVILRGGILNHLEIDVDLPADEFDPDPDEDIIEEVFDEPVIRSETWGSW